jgi:hypothetical protein
MANSLTQFLNTTNLPAIDGDAMAGALSDAADAATSGGGAGFDFLSFSGKTGRYSLGRNSDEVDPDQLYIVEPQSFISGWVCWKNSKPEHRIEWSVYKAAEQAVEEDELEDHGPYRKNAGEGWQQLLGFGLIGMDAVFSQVKFSSTSKSGRNSIGDLMQEIGARSAAKEPNMPLISFSSTSFEAQGQTNYKPVLVIDAWATRDSVAAYLEGNLNEDQLIAGDKPKARAKKAAPKKK